MSSGFDSLYLHMKFEDILAEAMEDVLVHIETCSTCNDRMNMEDCPELHIEIAKAYESAFIMDTLTFGE